LVSVSETPQTRPRWDGEGEMGGNGFIMGNMDAKTRKLKSVEYLKGLINQIQADDVEIFEIKEERGMIVIPNDELGIVERIDNGERYFILKFMKTQKGRQ
jgi:hypothetical protein